MAEDQPTGEVAVFLTYGQYGANPTAHRLLRTETIFLRSYLASADVKAAAAEAKMSVASAKEALARPEIRQYVEERMLERAGAAGITSEKVLFAVNHLLENPMLEVSAAHLKALDIAAKILKLIQPSNQITNNIMASPFKEMDDVAFNAEMQKRLAYRGEIVPTQEPKHHA